MVDISTFSAKRVSSYSSSELQELEQLFRQRAKDLYGLLVKYRTKAKEYRAALQTGAITAGQPGIPWSELGDVAFRMAEDSDRSANICLVELQLRDL